MDLAAVLAHTAALEDALASFGRHAEQQLTTTGRGRGLEVTVPSQFQELEERLSQILFQSRNLRNALSSEDGALPDDLLYLILEQACVVQIQPLPSPWNHSSIFYGSSRFSSSTARDLSCVCRRWRLLLLSNPVVWSDVSIMIRKPENLSWLEACLARSTSSSAGCMIQINRPLRVLPGLDVKEVMSRHQLKIRCLKIKLRTNEDYGFLALKMENLERLHIDDGTYCRTPIPTALHLGKLRAVILQRLPVVPSDAFFNLTDLTLHNILSPVDNLVDVLQANQTLEVVRINETAVAEDPQRRLISLPNLKLLCISYSSPVIVLHMVNPLPTPSQVIVRVDPSMLIASGISEVFCPFLIFGPNDPVLAASISMLPEEASITFHTFTGSAVQIIAQADLMDGWNHPEFSLFLETLSSWGPFPNLRSMDLHIERRATGPVHTATIHTLLSAMPKMTRLSFKGHTLCLSICQALDLRRAYETICPELEYLGGTLYPNDPIADTLRSLSDVLKSRPNIQEVALGALLLAEKVEGVLEESGSLIEEIKSRGVHGFSFTPITEWSRIDL